MARDPIQHFLPNFFRFMTSPPICKFPTRRPDGFGFASNFVEKFPTSPLKKVSFLLSKPLLKKYA